MLKRIIYTLMIAAFSMSACNDNESTGAATMPAAEKQWRELIKQYPDSLALRNKLVEYFAENNDYYNALRETNILLQKDSGNAAHWDTKARLLFLNGDTLGAIEAFHRAIKVVPDPEYVISLATLYAQTKNKSALSLAEALLTAPSGNASLQAYFIQGLYFNNTGDKTRAIEFFDKCLSIDYMFMDAYREKAIALYDLAKYSEAIAVLEKSLTVQRTFDEAWYWMGRCYQKLNKNKEAMESYRLALQIDPNFIEAKDALGKMGTK